MAIPRDCFWYGTHEFYSRLRYVFFLIISLLLLNQFWRDKTQHRECVIVKYENQMNPFICFENTRVQFFSFFIFLFFFFGENGTGRNGTHLKLKKILYKNVLIKYSGVLLILSTVSCLYHLRILCALSRQNSCVPYLKFLKYTSCFSAIVQMLYNKHIKLYSFVLILWVFTRTVDTVKFMLPER